MDGTVEGISLSPTGQRTHTELLFICNILHCAKVNGPRVLEPNLLDQIQWLQMLPW